MFRITGVSPAGTFGATIGETPMLRLAADALEWIRE